jgi:hypothetical protein
VDRACVDWVRHIAPSADTSASAESVDDFGDVESPLFDVDPSSDDQAQIVHELEMMAPHLMLSPLGRSLITTNSYLDNPVGAARFVVHLRHFDAHSDAAFVLNLNTGTFERADMSLREAVFTVPAGVQFNAADLAAVLSGRLHIWELATSRARQWYLTDRLESPIAFLFGYLGEHTRPDLLANLYATLSQQSL